MSLYSWYQALKHHPNRMLGDRKTINRNDYLASPLSIQVITPWLQERRLYDAMYAINKVIQAKDFAAKL